MPLPEGLIPVFVFVLTVGISVPVAMAAFLFARRSRQSFEAGLQVAVVEAASLYLIGVLAVSAIAGGSAAWPVAGTLLLVGIMAFGGLMGLPLLVGRLIVQRVRSLEDQQAYRVVTAGWPPAMLGVFLLFIAPGGLTGGDLFSLSGPTVCTAGFCGISLPFALAVGLATVLAVFGPGVIGVVLAISTENAVNRELHQ